jgi:probable HAF family extracellular repeat protein
MMSLGVLDGEDESEAFDVNSAGDVAGSSFTRLPPQFFSVHRATLWRAGGEIVDLGLVPAPDPCTPGFAFWPVSVARAINDRGQVVGDARCISSGAPRAAFLWEDGVMRNLEDLVPGSGWTLQSALDISAEGHIVGYGLAPGGGLRAFMMIDNGPGCSADCDGSGALDFFDFLCFQNLFAAGDPEADCDGSGDLNFFDFLCFQNEFAAGCP